MTEQPTDRPGSPAFRARLLALGAGLDDALRLGSMALFAPFHEQSPYAGVTVARDLAYGPHPRQQLDIFTPMDGGGPRPVVIFVHGGGFTGGARRTPGTPFHDNVALWAARAGFVGVNMTYRVAPEATWPAGATDLAAAIALVEAIAGHHGGDPERIVLLGTSAGATHVATYLGGVVGAVAPSIRAAALLSGLYDLTEAPVSANVQAYFGADATRYHERLSARALAATDVPLMLTVSENDPIRFVNQACAFAKLYFETRGTLPHAFRVMGHNHFSSTLQLNSPDDTLARELLWFFHLHLH